MAALCSSRVAKAAVPLKTIDRSLNTAPNEQAQDDFESVGIDISQGTGIGKDQARALQGPSDRGRIQGFAPSLSILCLSPKDTEHRERARFINLAGKVNNRMPARMAVCDPCPRWAPPGASLNFRAMRAAPRSLAASRDGGSRGRFHSGSAETNPGTGIPCHSVRIHDACRRDSQLHCPCLA